MWALGGGAEGAGMGGRRGAVRRPQRALPPAVTTTDMRPSVSAGQPGWLDQACPRDSRTLRRGILSVVVEDEVMQEV